MAAGVGARRTGRRCGQQHRAAADGSRRRRWRGNRASAVWKGHSRPPGRSRRPLQGEAEGRPSPAANRDRRPAPGTASPRTAEPETPSSAPPSPSPPAQKHRPRHRLPRHRPPRNTALGTASPALPVLAAGGAPITPRPLRSAPRRARGGDALWGIAGSSSRCGSGAVPLRDGPSRPSCTGSQAAALSGRGSVNRVVCKYQKPPSKPLDLAKAP